VARLLDNGYVRVFGFEDVTYRPSGVVQQVGEFPFYFVQLAPYHAVSKTPGNSPWAGDPPGGLSASRPPARRPSQRCARRSGIDLLLVASLQPIVYDASALRARISGLLRANHPNQRHYRALVEPCLVPMAEVTMQRPVDVGDYTDFYASIHHATSVGKMMRPDNPLLPNYKWVPIGYHGRASSVVVSGTPVRRPSGQLQQGSDAPVYAPSRQLDYECEVGFFIGQGNDLGQPIPIADAEDHLPDPGRVRLRLPTLPG
jgi:hypothetical protein